MRNLVEKLARILIITINAWRRLACLVQLLSNTCSSTGLRATRIERFRPPLNFGGRLQTGDTFVSKRGPRTNDHTVTQSIGQSSSIGKWSGRDCRSLALDCWIQPTMQPVNIVILLKSLGVFPTANASCYSMWYGWCSCCHCCRRVPIVDRETLALTSIERRMNGSGCVCNQAIAWLRHNIPPKIAVFIFEYRRWHRLRGDKCGMFRITLRWLGLQLP